ncbi:hypothetical protein EON66_05820 [archaeon]|nr:MAG: hypothetical protein EON66_05820 [archaeon]
MRVGDARTSCTSQRGAAAVQYTGFVDDMEVVALISGGKDSIFNCMAAVAAGHRVSVLANLYPAPAGEEASSHADVQELDSFMFQTVGHTAVECLARAMRLPLVRRQTAGQSIHRGLHYPTPPTAATREDDAVCVTTGESVQQRAVDEVEDLFLLLQDVKRAFPSVQAVACGAILSSYQRVRVEAVAARLGLTVMSYLWQREQTKLLDDMVRAGGGAVGVSSPHPCAAVLAQLDLSARVHACTQSIRTHTLHCRLLLSWMQCWSRLPRTV